MGTVELVVCIVEFILARILAGGSKWFKACIGAHNLQNRSWSDLYSKGMLQSYDTEDNQNAADVEKKASILLTSLVSSVDKMPLHQCCLSVIYCRGLLSGFLLFATRVCDHLGGGAGASSSSCMSPSSCIDATSAMVVASSWTNITINV